MFIYILPFTLSILISYGIRKNRIDNKVFIINNSNRTINFLSIKNTIILIISSLPLCFISGFRYGIGTDYFFTYDPEFYKIANGGDSEYEIGFYLLNKLILIFTRNSQWIFIITSFIFVILVFKAFYDNSSDMQFSILLFAITEVFFISMNNVRQSLACAIVLYGFKYIKKDEVFRFFLYILLATSIHRISILFIVLIFFRKINISINKLILIALAIIIFNPILKKVIYFLINNIDRFSQYFHSSMYIGNTLSSIIFGINIGIFIFIIYTKKYIACEELDKYPNYYDYFIVIQLICIIICTFDGFIPATYRLLRVFTFFQMLFISNFISLYKSRIIRIILKCGFATVFSCHCYYNIFLKGGEAVVPYISIFSK
ncbi:EpsG family protein [Clostridium butyricum]